MYVTFKKTGGFYTVYYDDVYVLYYLFHYQIKNNKVGFPHRIYNKIINRLEEHYINYIVEDKKIKKDFKKKNQYQLFVEKGKKLYQKDQVKTHLLEEISKLNQQQIDELLQMIENYVSNRQISNC